MPQVVASAQKPSPHAAGAPHTGQPLASAMQLASCPSLHCCSSIQQSPGQTPQALALMQNPSSQGCAAATRGYDRDGRTQKDEADTPTHSIAPRPGAPDRCSASNRGAVYAYPVSPQMAGEVSPRPTYDATRVARDRAWNRSRILNRRDPLEHAQRRRGALVVQAEAVSRRHLRRRDVERQRLGLQIDGDLCYSRERTTTTEL